MPQYGRPEAPLFAMTMRGEGERLHKTIEETDT